MKPRIHFILAIISIMLTALSAYALTCLGTENILDFILLAIVSIDAIWFPWAFCYHIDLHVQGKRVYWINFLSIRDMSFSFLSRRILLFYISTSALKSEDSPMSKREIEIKDPEKLLPWIGGPYMAAGTLVGAILLIGFTPDLLFVNYLFEALFLYLFCLSYKNRYKAYKAEPNLKITSYFWIELAIHSFFIIAATVHSALNIWISISEEGLTYRHEYFFITLIIIILHVVYVCIDYYATEKAAIVRYCNRMRKSK